MANIKKFFSKDLTEKITLYKRDDESEGDRVTVSEEEPFRQGKQTCKSSKDSICLVCVRRHQKAEQAGNAGAEQRGQRGNEGPDHLGALPLTGM